MPSSDVKVVYVLGWGRSGSTLLDNLLGGVDGFFSTGELHSLWRGGLLERRRCGCGVAVPDCGIWRAVMDVAFDGGGLDPATLVAWRERSIGMRNTPRLLRDRGAALADKALASYASASARLYRAISEVTGARVVVDSSKLPAIGALLSALPGVEPYYVHLVRDPRGVAHSWRRRKRDPDRDFYSEMDRYSAIKSATKWVKNNVGADAVVRRFEPERATLVRYEDFVRDPRATVARIVALAREGPFELPFADDSSVLLEPNHTVSGNPARFNTGVVTFTEDDEWVTLLEKRDRIITTALTWPMLLRYGYPLRVPRPVRGGRLEAAGTRSGPAGSV